ncbi:hypothetical protein PG993_007341 [Apiospora rasikravindrae]|uniref:Uncharacterized protein n=1 Tax=Apiospora rasikravindrae TaxID=990691 RepID=A0ABR1SZ12_9PEZI
MESTVFHLTILACTSTLAEACTRAWMCYTLRVDNQMGPYVTVNYEVWDHGQRGACVSSNFTIALYPNGSASQPFFSIELNNLTSAVSEAASDGGCTNGSRTPTYMEWEMCFNSEQQDCEDFRCNLCGLGSTSCPQY